MPRFRKKPIVIEAFHMTEACGSNNSEWPEWLHEAWQREPNEPNSLYILCHEPRQFAIYTLEGEHAVTWGDYIIQGVQGELYPCKPDIFDATYESVPRDMPEFKCTLCDDRGYYSVPQMYTCSCEAGDPSLGQVMSGR